LNNAGNGHHDLDLWALESAAFKVVLRDAENWKAD
jgi:hypothetical protein